MSNGGPPDDGSIDPCDCYAINHFGAMQRLIEMVIVCFLLLFYNLIFYILIICYYTKRLDKVNQHATTENV